MARDKTRDLRKMNRRNFLSKLSAMGISGAALQYMTKDALAEVTDDPKDEVPRLAYVIREDPDDDERQAIYYTIPYDKWKRIQATNKAFRNIKEKLYKKDLLHTVKVSVATHPTNIKQVSVEYIVDSSETSNLFEDTSAVVPSTTSAKLDGELIENIPVSLDRVNNPITEPENKEDFNTESNNHYFDEAYDDIPAGCKMTGKRGGTVGFEATKGNDDVLITAAHNFIYPWEDEDDLEKGARMTQPQYIDNKAGELSDWVYNEYAEDAAVVTLEPDNGTSRYHAAKGGGYRYDKYTAGIIAWDLIEDEELELKRQGMVSGWGTGDITHTNPDTYEFRINLSSEEGGSGGPVYNEIDGHANAMGGITTRDWAGNETIVFAAEKIENELGIEI